jgi:uncharacterized protein Usg
MKNSGKSRMVIFHTSYIVYIQNAAECTILRPSEKKTPPTAFSLSRVGMHEMVVSYIHDTVLLVYIWQEYDLDQNHTRHNQSNKMSFLKVKAVGGVFFSEERKMVHSAAFWI